MRVAIYPGTFDPITNGHMDILTRASKLFDRVIVAVAAESGKGPLFSLEERMQMAAEACASLGKVEVTSFSGLIVEFAKAQGAVALIKGLRAVSDFEAEFQMALMNRKLAPEVETLFMMTEAENAYLSSSIVKEVASLGGCVRGLVPSVVESRLRGKFA